MILSRIALSLLLLPASLLVPAANAQNRDQIEGPQPTQALVTVNSKTPAALTPADLSLSLNGRSVPVSAVALLQPSQTQVAILIDDGLRTSVARELGEIQKFIQSLPAGTEVLVGYMQNGHVAGARQFTSNLAGAAAALRIPFGAPGMSASPYFCLSDFAKNWPTESSVYGDRSTPGRKARFVLLLTNGVDPYNGSVSPLNQDSPYVETATRDAQRAGISVSSIYYGDAGMRGGAANASGQNYLFQIAEATGGTSYYEGRGNPVSLAPYLLHFKNDIANTEVVTFTAPPSKDLLGLKLNTKVRGVKLRYANQIRPGTTIVSGTR